MIAKVPTIRVLVDCQCGQQISFYPATDVVRFLVQHNAPDTLPIHTERCRNCRTVVAVTVKDVGWRSRAA